MSETVESKAKIETELTTTEEVIKPPKLPPPPKPISKKITEEQIQASAEKLGVEPETLKAVMQIECRGSGFLPTGEPVILFERHWFWRLLGKQRWWTARLKFMRKHPRICNPRAGGYGRYSSQHAKLQVASRFNRDCALMACSWGLGQVMGFHWQKLGYASLQDFVNAMYENEANQLDAMVRYIQVFGLADELQNKNWSGFAYGYNGRAFRKNRYDEKLAMAYHRHKSLNSQTAIIA